MNRTEILFFWDENPIQPGQQRLIARIAGIGELDVGYYGGSGCQIDGPLKQTFFPTKDKCGSKEEFRQRAEKEIIRQLAMYEGTEDDIKILRKYASERKRRKRLSEEAASKRGLLEKLPHPHAHLPAGRTRSAYDYVVYLLGLDTPSSWKRAADLMRRVP